MPLVKISAASEYFLINHDEAGRERREADGGLLSDMAVRLLDDPASRVTDVFVMSHGWQGDLPAARGQYDAWLGAVVGLADGPAAARARAPDFHPLVLGLHWPSLPWGDETVTPAAPGLLGGPAATAAGDDVETWARRTADTPAARAALSTILRLSATEPALTDELRAAYAALAREMAVPATDADGRPGTDDPPFDPDGAVARAAAQRGDGGGGGGFVLGGWGDGARDLLLTPLRQLSFWRMKDRARIFGEGGAHDLLARIQDRPADRRPRVHLMGHSFGCIVAAAAVAGPPTDPRIRVPVSSLFLVQGALSLWAFAPDIPVAPGTAGYFSRIVRERLVRGPVVATTSEHDRAVRLFYPLGARAAGQVVLGAAEPPRYGGLGAYGIRGVDGARDMAMLPASGGYGFEAGAVVNLDASAIIRTGGGAAGAHSDIVHPEVAHAFWEAAISAMPAEPHPQIASADGAAAGGRVGGVAGPGADGSGQPLPSPVTVPTADLRAIREHLSSRVSAGIPWLEDGAFAGVAGGVLGGHGSGLDQILGKVEFGTGQGGKIGTSDSEEGIVGAGAGSPFILADAGAPRPTPARPSATSTPPSKATPGPNR